MIPIPTAGRVWIATGHTDMRRGMRGLALQVQEGLQRDPHGGIFSFSEAAEGTSRSADVLSRIASHPAHRLNELLPWNWQSRSTLNPAQAA